MPAKDTPPEEKARIWAARQSNLKALVDFYGSNVDVAEVAGLVPAHVSQVKNGTRNMGGAVARRIEIRLDLPDMAMDRVGLKIDDTVAEKMQARAVAISWLNLPKEFRPAAIKAIADLMEIATKAKSSPAPANPPQSPGRPAEKPKARTVLNRMKDAEGVASAPVRAATRSRR